MIPEYPKILHLPHAPNMAKGDSAASHEEAFVVFGNKNVVIEEKLDGSNCAITIVDNHPVIRNRTHILKKGFVKDTPAKQQFRPIWGWFYENKDKFEMLASKLGFMPVIYGEWMVAVHGIRYDQLFDYFLAYELYDPENQISLPQNEARLSLCQAGFSLPPLLHEGKFDSYEYLIQLTEQPSSQSSCDQREGLVIKVSDNKKITHRFKMVRPGFVQGQYWSDEQITKNKKAK